MTCWSCGLPLPEGARFCARCGVRQRLPGGSAPVWMMVMFTFGAVAAGSLALTMAGAILRSRTIADPAAAQFTLAFSWAFLLYGVALAGMQVAALVGLAASRDWGRIAATLACLLWCLTGFGLVVSFPVLYYLWRPQPFRR